MTSYGSRTVKRHRRSDATLEELDDVIVRVTRAEHPVSLRGVFYRVVSAGAIDKTEAGYRVVGRQLLKLRRAGRVPYRWITDGTRWVIDPGTYDSLETALDEVASSYRRTLWNDQDEYVYMFTEKDAISGVIGPVTREWHVPLGVVRGFSSESFAKQTADLIARRIRTHDVFVYNLGDHDPSGVDAWRDFSSKIRDFLAADGCDDEVRFQRLAVTPDQIRSMNLLTRPTKSSDTRAKGFVGESVEVDAIPADALRRLVRNAIEQHIEPGQLALTRSVEASERKILSRIVGDL